MELIFLGTGPGEPTQADGRTRSSIFVSSGMSTFMIDCTPDFLEQAKRENIDRIDFILFTHAHPDAVGGIPQLQKWMEKKDMDRIVVFMEKDTADKVKEQFKELSHLDIRYFSPYVPFTVNNVRFEPFRIQQLEGASSIVGFRFLDIVYSEDNDIQEQSLKYYQKADTIILKNNDNALQLALDTKPNNLILIQASSTTEDAQQELRVKWTQMMGDSQTNVVFAKDGLRYKMHDHIEQMLSELREGMMLAYPHGLLTYGGEKSLIVKSKLFKNNVGRIFYILEDSLCYGLLKLKYPMKINLKEFEELRERHQITDDERKKWWPGKEILYAYDFDVVKLYDNPKRISMVQGAETFANEFEFLDGEVELIKDIKAYDPEAHSLEVLHDDWRIVCAWYSSIKKGVHLKHSLEDVIHLARLIYGELSKRGAEFHPETMTPNAKDLFNIVSGVKKELQQYDLSDPNILKEFDDKILIKDFISVCGSMVAPYGDRKPHDIDLVIRMEQPTDYLKRAIEVRILKDLGFSDKVHFIWGDPEGPHDSFIPIYDLKISKIRPLKVVHMNTTEVELSTMTPVDPMKPSKRFYQVDELLDYMFKSPGKFGIEKKYNGFRCTVNKAGNMVKMYSDQRKSIEDKFPTLAEQAKKLSAKDFIVDCELVYEGGGRTEILKFIMGKERLDDSKMELHAFDCLQNGSDDLTSRPWYERKSILHSMNFGRSVQEVHTIVVDSKDQANKAINLVRNMKGSEGAMVKRYEGKYTKGGETDAWIKFRNEDALIVKIVEVHDKEGGKSYGIAIPIESKDKFNPDYLTDDGDLYLGNTFVTKEDFKVGDKIEVNIEEVWRHEYKDDKIRYSIHKPKVIGSSSAGFSSWEALDKLAVSKGESITENDDGATTTGTPGISDIAGKIWKKKIIEAPKLLEQMTEVELEEKEGGEVMVDNFPDRMQRDFKKVLNEWQLYTMQWHLRGSESIHTDLRMDTGTQLEGFTLFTPGSTDGEDLLTQDPHNIRGTIKLPQPVQWLEVNGGYKSGAPGTTSKHNAYFGIISKGRYRPLIVEDHRIVFEMKSDSAPVKRLKPLTEDDAAAVEAFNKKLPDTYKQFEGCYSYHIAHIGDSHIILFDKLAECPKVPAKEEQPK